MKTLKTVILIFLAINELHAEELKKIHIFVALCDNAHQGIVPVSASLGNGQNPKSNLYWGALYGVETFLKRKGSPWNFVSSLELPDKHVLKSSLFHHSESNALLLAEAYDGAHMRETIEDFLSSVKTVFPRPATYKSQIVTFGDSADLVIFVGHNGLMDFDVNISKNMTEKTKDFIILACYSKSYFSPHFEGTNHRPLMWSTNLMAPEAYTVEAALEGWLKGESMDEIRIRGAKAYAKYQKCSSAAAKKLLVCGY